MNTSFYLSIMISSVVMFNTAQAEEKICSPVVHYTRAGFCLLWSSFVWGVRSGDIAIPLLKNFPSKSPGSWLAASAVTVPVGIYGIMQIALGNAKYNAAELKKIEVSRKLSEN